jgi:N4-gp56 family major capsid protein
MADTVVAAGLRKQQWESKFFTEYLTESRFSESYGSDENAVIQIKESLSKGKGDSITIALVNRLTNAAVLGSNLLEGFEEDMSSRSMRIYIDKRRNAVRIAEMEEYKSAIDLRDAGRATLKDWAMKDTEQLICDALGSIDGKTFASSTAGERNAWNTNNWDRVLFGAAKGNNGATAGSVTHLNALLTIDNTADKLTPAALDLMKEIAVTCDPKITPVRVEKSKGRRYYIAYAAPGPFRDLRGNAAMQQAQREVVLETENNRLFEGGDLLWNGIIVKEVPTIPTAVGLGNGGINVAPVYLCGAQAVAIAYGKRWSTVTKTFDYGDKYGIAIEGIMGVRKIIFGTDASVDTTSPRDNGVVTGWFASVPSA